MKKRFSASALAPQIWFLLFLAGPLALVVIVSFLQRGAYGGLLFQFSGVAYQKLLNVSFLRIFISSLWLALMTTVICAVIAVPLSWAIATALPGRRMLWLAAVVLPFFINLIVRIYAIKLVVQREGPLDDLLTALGVAHDPFSWDQNFVLVMYAMVTTYLPFMIFPIYGALEKFDFTLIEAAQDLGAKNFVILRSILLPGLRKALISGSLMVFIPALGEFVIPDLLGGAKTMLIGNLITEEFLKARDWPLGAALAVALLTVLGLIGWAADRWATRSEGARSQILVEGQ